MTTAQPTNAAPLIYFPREPGGQWESVAEIEDLSGLAWDVRYHPAVEDALRKVQRFTGWTDEFLAQNWFNFMSYPIWHLFDYQHVTFAFWAITVLQIAVNMGALAWESAHDRD